MRNFKLLLLVLSFSFTLAAFGQEKDVTPFKNLGKCTFYYSQQEMLHVKDRLYVIKSGCEEISVVDELFILAPAKLKTTRTINTNKKRESLTLNSKNFPLEIWKEWNIDNVKCSRTVQDGKTYDHFCSMDSFVSLDD